jgi:phage/plasmid-associated DNA primase
LNKLYNKEYNKIFYKKLESIKNVINFKNGYINLQTGEFNKRVETDYFIKCLDYNYTSEIDEKIRDEIIKIIFKQICNDDEEMFNFMMSYFSYCLTGETREQKSLFTIGLKASNGKSTGTKIFETCFREYSRKLTNAFFKENNESVHKEIAELKGIRYAYMEEYPKNCNLNVDLYKDLVDGNTITNKVMYGTTEEIQITFKINILSNHIPKFENDKGILC